MQQSQLKVYLVARTEWTEPPVTDEPWEIWETDAPTSAEKLTEFAGRLCYMSFHKPNPATRENKNYVAHILESKHFSVIEHSGFSVVILGISRSCSHEIVRHRHFSVSQLSQRFVDESNANYVLPPLFEKSSAAQDIVADIVAQSQEAYQQLVDLGAGLLKSDPDKTARRKRAREAARFVLPNTTETAMVLTGNHRTWREFFEKRGNVHADAEIRQVALAIFGIARTIAPSFYQDMKTTKEGDVEVISLST